MPENALPMPGSRPAPAAGIAASLLLLLLACTVFANTFPGEYFLDDHEIVQTNPLVNSPDLAKIFLSDYWGGDVDSGLYRPLVIVSFALTHLLFGPGPLADHLSNVLLHALVSLLFYLVLLRWEVPRPVAWLAAALFAVHPIHTEVVNEAVGRAELLAALGVLLVLYVARTIRGWSRGPLLAASFLLGVLSKENAVTVLALLPLVDRFQWPKGQPGWWHRHWRDYLWLGATTLAWLAFRTWGVQRWAPPDAADPVYTPLKFMAFSERIVTALEVQWLYLWKQLVPVGLRGIYSGPGYLPSFSSPWSPLAGAVVLGSLALLVLAGWLYARRSLAGLALLLYAVAFAPTANILFVTGVTMAERLAYLPSLWFCLGTATVLAAGIQRLKRRRVGLSAAGLILVLLAALTVGRNQDFRSELTLWKADTARDSQNVLAWLYLGKQYWKLGEPGQSEAAYRHALQVAPDFGDALSAYAALLLEQNRFEEALRYALRAEAVSDSDVPTLHMVTANIYLALGRPEEADRWLEKARWLYSGDDYFRFLEGWVREAQGRGDEALQSYRSVREPRVQWKIPARLAGILLRQGNLPAAEAQLRKALEASPTAETWNRLGVALALQGRSAEARAAFAQAVRLAPNHPGYQENYGRLLRQAGESSLSRQKP